MKTKIPLLLLLIAPEIVLWSHAFEFEVNNFSETNIKGENNIKIVNGDEATPHEFPSLVYLNIHLVNESTGTKVIPICGGTIINETWILTAAQCVSPLRGSGMVLDNVWITAGDHYRFSLSLREQIQQYKNIIVHPDYNPYTFVNDVALVELSEPLIWDEYAQVGIVADTTFPLLENTEAIIAGWGRTSENSNATDELRKANVTFQSNEVCKTSFDGVPGVEIVDTMICAGGSNRTACYNDEGGPLYCSTPNSDALVVCGISTLVIYDGCGSDRYPTIHTRVAPYVGWIREYVPYLKTIGGGGFTEETTVTTTVGNNDCSCKRSNEMFISFSLITLIFLKFN